MAGSVPAASGPDWPGRALTHPVAILAVVILALNDHVLKGLFPGVATGKLSDLAGLVFFPVLLAELGSLGYRVAGRPRPARRLVLAAIALTAVTFALVKTTAAGGFGYAWGLGALQWLLTFGFVSGETLRPVMVAVDPTDLLALPALGLAWWIASSTDLVSSITHAGRRESGTRPTAPTSAWFGVFVAVASAVTSLATSQAMPESSSEIRETLRLTEDGRVVARHISWDASSTGSEPVILNVAVRQRATEDVVEDPSGWVEISLIPDDPTGTQDRDDFMESPGRTLDLTDACRAACSGGATVIVRLAHDRDDVTDFDLVTRLSVSGTADAEVAVRDDPDRHVDAVPSTVHVSASDTVKVTGEDPERRVVAVLTVDRALLDDPLAFPLVGRIAARVEVVDGAVVEEAHEVAVEVGNDSVWFTAERSPAELDWLAHCRPGSDCEIEINLISRYDPTLDGTVDPADSGSAGFVELRWTVDARLEAFDGRSLLDGAMKLELREAD